MLGFWYGNVSRHEPLFPAPSKDLVSLTLFTPSRNPLARSLDPLQVYDTGYFPVVSNRIFANNGKAYNITKILGADKTLDHAKYANYSKPYMAASNLMMYGGQSLPPSSAS